MGGDRSSVPGKADGHKQVTAQHSNNDLGEASAPQAVTTGQPCQYGGAAHACWHSCFARGEGIQSSPLTTSPGLTMSLLTCPFLLSAPASLTLGPLSPSTCANSMSPGSVKLSPLPPLPEPCNSPNWKNSPSLCPSELITSASRGAWSLSRMLAPPSR